MRSAGAACLALRLQLAQSYLSVLTSRYSNYLSPLLDKCVHVNLLGNYAELFNLRAFLLRSSCKADSRPERSWLRSTAASTLMKDMLQRPSTEFGIYFLTFPLGYLFGNFITSRIGSRVANDTHWGSPGSLGLIVTVAAQSARTTFSGLYMAAEAKRLPIALQQLRLSPAIQASTTESDWRPGYRCGW